MSVLVIWAGLFVNDNPCIFFHTSKGGKCSSVSTAQSPSFPAAVWSSVRLAAIIWKVREPVAPTYGILINGFKTRSWSLFCSTGMHIQLCGGRLWRKMQFFFISEDRWKGFWVFFRFFIILYNYEQEVTAKIKSTDAGDKISRRSICALEYFPASMTPFPWSPSLCNIAECVVCIKEIPRWHQSPMKITSGAHKPPSSQTPELTDGIRSPYIVGYSQDSFTADV